MKFKSLLFTMSMAVAMTANAATYYVSPEGAGTMDGSSPDNAFDITAFTTQAAANVNGDVYYFAGGSYYIPSTVVFKAATGAYLYGNEDGERTVLTGDTDGNGNPDNGEASRLIRLQANTVDADSSRPIVVKNIDFTCVYTNTGEVSNNSGALAIDNSGDVLVEGCKFYNNWAQGQQGGPAAWLYRSTVKFVDCIFSNNKANYRGGAVRIASNANTKGNVTFERCVFKNNKNFHTMGGAVFAANFKSITFINSTLTGNTAEGGLGAAIYFNGYASGTSGYPRLVQIISSTIAGNTVGDDVESDAQIATTQSAHIYIANSIITSNDGVGSIYFSGSTSTDAALVSTGGYNYLGSISSSVEGAPEITWADSDTCSEACTYASIFGENTLNNDNALLPATFALGATGEEVATAVSAAAATEEGWNFPSGVDYSVDQLGNARTANKTMGAIAMTAAEIENANSENQGSTGIIEVNGAESIVTVYNLQGIAVRRNVNSSDAISNLPAGIYIINGKKYLAK